MRRICIVGSAGPSNRLANELAPDVELWAMNMCHRFLTARANRWFQLHPRNWREDEWGPGNEDYEADQDRAFGRPPDHLEFLKNCGIPVYMQEQNSEIPTSMRYPLGEIIDRFGGYMTSTVPYMIALALHEGVDEIGLLGIYLETSGEYRDHRPCVEYWLGVARGMGVSIVLPNGCSLTKAPLYAYDGLVEPSETLKLESVEVLA